MTSPDDEIERDRAWVRHEVRQLRKRDRLVLTSWGVAVVIVATLLSWWIATNEREAAAAREQLQAQQDAAMCAMTSVIMSGPPPVEGPEGDRGREVLRAMTDYRATLGC